MKILVAGDGAVALCEGRNGRARINMLGVGPRPPGTWILAFQGMAREILSEEQALRIDRALDGLEAALRGETDLDRYFADLTGQEHESGAQPRQEDQA